MSEPLRLPEGCGIEMLQGTLDLLVFKRFDGSVAAAFEVSTMTQEVNRPCASPLHRVK